MNKHFLQLSILFLAIIILSLLFKRNTNEYFTFERPTPDSTGKCQVNGNPKNNWWSSGSTCYQMCISNSQKRDNLGRCLCNLRGDNQSCKSGLICKDNSCQENIQQYSLMPTFTTTTMAPTTTSTTMAPMTTSTTMATTTTMAPTTTSTTMAPTTTTTTMAPTTTSTTMAPTITMAPTTTSGQTTTMAPVEQNQTISTTTTYLEDTIDNSPFSLKNMSGSNMDSSNHGKVDGSATKIQKTFSSSNGIPIGDITPITQSNIPLGMPEVHDTVSKLGGRQGNIDMDLIHNPTDIDLNVGYNNY